MALSRYTIIVPVTYEECHFVEAHSPEEALQLYHEDKATYHGSYEDHAGEPFIRD